MNGRIRNFWALHRFRVIKAARSYLLFLAVTIAWFTAERFDMLDRVPGASTAQSTVDAYNPLYEIALRMNRQPVEADHVTLVDLGQPDSFADACAIRSFVAKLIPGLVQMRAVMIVSDVGFAESGNCGAERGETRALIASVAAASRTIPIVIAQGSWSLAELSAEDAENVRRHGSGDDLLIRPSIAFPSSERISFGLIRINQDVRRVPMQWFVHESTRGPRYLEDSLAFAAAEAHATSRGTKERLYRLRNAGYHPFISFLGQHEFTVANAEKLTCGSVGADQKRSSKCVKGEGDPAEQAKVQGRVALLGFTYDHSDLTTTVVGKMPGVVLQANYIEALVAGRTFSPLAPWIQWLLGSIWFVVSESMLWRFGPATLRGLTTWALVSFFAMVLIYYFVPVNTAHYVDMAPPSVFLVAARAVNERIEYIRLKLRPAAAEGVVP